MSNTDDELFELCKEVYKRTGWNKTEFLWVAPPLNDIDYTIMHKSKLHELNDYIKHPEMVDKMYNSTFCYDTDYLLEKLPRTFSSVALALWAGGSQGWIAEYDGMQLMRSHADTPLKALLRLTIALHDAGELNQSEYK